MRTSDNTGGPAFPVAFVQGTDPHGADAAPGNDGMTLLDWFAGQALAGLVSDSKRFGGFHAFASDAYKLAGAMLAEKARREATGKDCLQVPDHSPDAGKMAKLEGENRELVEALRECDSAFAKFCPDEDSRYGMAWKAVRDALAKAKETKP